VRTALLQLAEDFISTIVFLIVFVATGELPLAVALALATGVAQIALFWWRGRPVDLMQGLSLALVVAFGAAALITDDSRFMMAKPSVIHVAVGVVMLRRGWLARYMPPVVNANVPHGVIVATGYAWAALMFALGALNLYVATHFDIATWSWFISVGALGAKAAAFGLQVIVFRILIRRRLRPTAA
jgi:intracellular septation protein